MTFCLTTTSPASATPDGDSNAKSSSHGGICLCLPYGRVSGRLAAGSVDSVTDSAFEVGVIISEVDEIIALTQLQPCHLKPQGSHSITDGMISNALVRAAVTGTGGRQAAVTVTVQNARETPTYAIASYRLGTEPNEAAPSSDIWRWLNRRPWSYQAVTPCHK